MGDFFFIIKMSVYTFVIVILMQVKIGPTTIEQKVIEFTHHSEIAGVLQKTAQGAATFLGVQFRKATGSVKTEFANQYSESQRPGSRLQSKVKEWKKSLKATWKEKSEDLDLESLSHGAEKINHSKEGLDN